MNSRLSRDFTLKEKILLLILSCILIGAFYFYAVDQPVRTELTAVKAETEDLEMQQTTLTAEVKTMESMSNELDETKNTPSMPSYNGIKLEIAFLNDVLQSADTYNMNFADVTRDKKQIRRDVDLTFTASDYTAAEAILKELADSPYRCLLGDVQIAATNRDKDYNLSNGQVSVALTMTFYETMVGGTPDDGLPKQEDAAANDSDTIDDYLDEYYSDNN